MGVGVGVVGRAVCEESVVVWLMARVRKRVRMEGIVDEWTLTGRFVRHLTVG